MEIEKFLKCPNCLSPISIEFESCPHCKVDLYTCSNCNAMILEKDTICKNCNSKLDDEKADKPLADILNPRAAYEYKPLEVLTNI